MTGGHCKWMYQRMLCVFGPELAMTSSQCLVSIPVSGTEKDSLGMRLPNSIELG